MRSDFENLNIQVVTQRGKTHNESLYEFLKAIESCLVVDTYPTPRIVYNLYDGKGDCSISSLGAWIKRDKSEECILIDTCIKYVDRLFLTTRLTKIFNIYNPRLKHISYPCSQMQNVHLIDNPVNRLLTYNRSIEYLKEIGL